jgi:hypothetical protein
VSASSAIHEREIDTHLNVLHIAKTSIYDNLSDRIDALDLMWSTYRQRDAWHYQDPNTGLEPDLHHGVFYKGMGGGVAYLSAICDSYSGFGVSAGMKGTIQDIAESVSSALIIWDIYIFAHELGVSQTLLSISKIYDSISSFLLIYSA